MNAAATDNLEYLRIIEQSPAHFVVEQPARPGLTSWLALVIAAILCILAVRIFRNGRRALAASAAIAGLLIGLVGLWDGGSRSVNRLTLDLNARTFTTEHRYGSRVTSSSTTRAADVKEVTLDRAGSTTSLILVHWPRGGVDMPLTMVEDPDLPALQQTLAVAQAMLQKQRRVEAGLPDPPTLH